MVRSKLWATQEALATMIQASPSIGTLLVKVGTPVDYGPENVYVASEVNEWNASYAVSGVRAKDETFVLRVGILVTRLGTEFLPARDRVKALGEIVEDVIAADRTLSGNVELAVIERAELDDMMLDERRRGVLLTIYVRCRAWLNT